jgi:hypothetical protein
MGWDGVATGGMDRTGESFLPSCAQKGGRWTSSEVKLDGWMDGWMDGRTNAGTFAEAVLRSGLEDGFLWSYRICRTDLDEMVRSYYGWK